MLSPRPLLWKIKQALRDPQCALCDGETLEANRLFCSPCSAQLGFRAPEPIRAHPQAKLYAASRFTPKIRSILYGYKFQGQRDAWRVLSATLTTYWNTVRQTDKTFEQGIVCPIPARDGSPSHLLPYVRDFADAFGYRVEPHLLQWTRPTVPQHSLHRKSERLANVTGSMTVSKNVLKPSMANARMVIILVDDILTTGVTLGEAIRTLRLSLPENLSLRGLTLTHIPLSYR